MVDVLNSIETSRNSGWNLNEIRITLEKAHWKPALTDIDTFGEYIARFEITFCEVRSDSVMEPTAKEKAVANELIKIIQEKRSTVFASASRIASVVEEALGSDNPIPIIESHLRMLLDGADERGRSTKEALSEDSDFFEILRFLGALFTTSWPREPRVQVITYWLTSPFSKTPHGLSAKTLKKHSGLRSPYASLIFDRFTYRTYADRLDPPVRHWTEFTWALAYANTPAEMTRAVGALFELKVQSEPEIEGYDDAAKDINAFFHRVMKAQETYGGRSFWDAETTFAVGECFTWWWNIYSRKPIEIDLPSHFSYLVNEWDDAGPPEWHLWNQLIDRLLGYGYTKVAQAVVSYALLDETIAPNSRISDWRTVVALVRRLREEPHFEVLAPSLRLLRAVLDTRGERLLASRLEGYADSQRQLSPAVIYKLREFQEPVVGSEEIQMGLIEHTGRDNWEKFSPEARTWLIEANLNWRIWRYTKRGKEFDRTDWSPIALQFSKAIEHELVSRYGEACKKHGHYDKAGRVSLGHVIQFLGKAANGDAQHQETLETIGRKVPDGKLVDRLYLLNGKFRNPAAHPAEFPLNLVESLREELFAKKLLREIADGLL